MKESRNQKRKAHYASLANKGSRNQESINGQPIIGRLVTVDTEEFNGKIVKVKPYQKIVHDDKAPRVTVEVEEDGQINVVDVPVAPAASNVPIAPAASNFDTYRSREPSAQKRRRQIAAWTRCATLKETGAHDIAGVNCHCCGCPEAEQSVGREP